eukprot:COSAG01_NODE_4351_length_5111_cov_2.539689_1_plen_151_part_00
MALTPGSADTSWSVGPGRKFTVAVVPCTRQTEAARRRARSSEAELSQLRCTTGPSAVASSTGGAASGAASAACRPPGAVVARARARSSAALCRAVGILAILVPAGVGRCWAGDLEQGAAAGSRGREQHRQQGWLTSSLESHRCSQFGRLL